MNEIIVSMKNIQKRFAGVHALDDAQLTLHKGEVLGLIGENGAGKSTLMKILSGIYQQDSGQVEVDGRKVEYKVPKDALDDGICMIHQELNLIPKLSVADNIFIGRESKNGPVLDKGKDYQRAKELLTRLELDIDCGKTTDGRDCKRDLLPQQGFDYGRANSGFGQQ